ncbi:MAG: hypothetical protein JJE04_17215 [Acidobacteriia bacterium]|nr:hypothetical protein [Terriglobia bacterium]
MRVPIFLFIVASGCLCLAAEKELPKGEASGKKLKIEAIAYLDKSSIQQAVGPGMEEGIVVVEVKLIPAPGQKLNVVRDDFLLRSDNDGQRATPYSPSQIAGASVLRVNTRYGGGGVAAEDRGPVWGGLGGGMGRMPGSGGGFGNSAGTTEAVGAVQEASGKEKESPLLASLKEKVLPESEISQPAQGQLYFLMEGKQKVKHLELLYRGGGEKLSIRFLQPK